MIRLCLALLLLATPALAGPCKQKSLAGTWRTTWIFGNGQVICSMLGQTRIDNYGNVQPGARYKLRMNGGPEEVFLATGGNLTMVKKEPTDQYGQYCDFKGTIELDHPTLQTFEVELQIGHDEWGDVVGQSFSKGALNPTDDFIGNVYVNNGAVGTFQGLERSPTKTPFP